MRNSVAPVGALAPRNCASACATGVPMPPRPITLSDRPARRSVSVPAWSMPAMFVAADPRPEPGILVVTHHAPRPGVGRRRGLAEAFEHLVRLEPESCAIRYEGYANLRPWAIEVSHDDA